MKKSSFVALVLGTISGMFFALGMCMALLPEWNAFRPGVVMGVVGIVLGLVTFAIWLKMTGKEPIKLSPKTVFSVVVGIVGALLLGVGMCFCMVWNKMVLGIVIGMVGIVVLLSLIPLTKGLK
ncbi:MAG: hypothetical protein J6R66_00485 [Clostridia bacterium]|nr:hypothetical protein [Clostridia bacterium]